MTHIVTLTNGTVYVFRVRAVNGVGDSPDSDETTVTPGVPTEPQLAAVRGDSSAALSASVSNTNGSAITKWQYQQKAGGSDYGPWTDIDDASASLTHTVTGLTNGTSYTFKVRAVNSSGNSADSDEAAATPAAVPTKPVLAGASGDSSAVLSASVSSTNGSGITKWQYQQKAGVADYGPWVDIPSADTTITHTVNGLTNGTAYSFRVRAVNGVGDSPDSDETTVTPGVPTEPQLAAVGGDSSAALSASVSSTNGSDITKWQYQQKAGVSGYGPWTDIADTGTSIAHTIAGLTNGTAYTFKVRAVNSAGNSAESDEATVTPAAIPVKPALAGVPGDGSAVLSAVVSNDNGSSYNAKWQYQQKSGVSAYGSWTDIASTGPSMAHVITGLTNGTAYSFKVRAVNGVGDSPDSNEVTVVSGVPAKPALAAVRGDSSAVLSASVSSNNGSAITKWQYQQKSGGSGYGCVDRHRRHRHIGDPYCHRSQQRHRIHIQSAGREQFGQQRGQRRSLGCARRCSG